MKRVLAVLCGQSNEAGAGESPDANTSSGAPVRDPVGIYGSVGMRSMWPRLAALMGAMGVWVDVAGTAVGGAGLIPTWTGFVRDWVSGMPLPWGSYVRSSDGGLWRANLTPGTLGSTTTQPSGTANATLNGIPWVYVGLAGADDANRTVYRHGSPLFDPSGYVAGMYNAAAAGLPNYDEVWLLISIGQGDTFVGATRAEYAAGLRAVIDRALPVVTRVFVGYTVYSANPGSDAWVNTHLLPARQDVLADYASNPKVFAGANLRESLGVLPVSPASKLTPGMKADNVHMNDAAYSLASDAWAAAIIATGAA